MRSSASWLAAAAQSRGSVHDRRMAWLGSVPAAAPAASFCVVAAARTAPVTSAAAAPTAAHAESSLLSEDASSSSPSCPAAASSPGSVEVQAAAFVGVSSSRTVASLDRWEVAVVVQD
ncbi:hypothetical protein ACP70R_034704 [Stipagrostis hirtigluma subsp. patula]